MAFLSAKLGVTVIGNKRMAFGTFTNNSSSTGGDINTTLTTVEFIVLQAKGSGVAANAPVVNETLPVAGSAVTIVTDADEVGYWFAFGR